MSNYIGVRCPVCNKKFTEADDIVVCPVCGAPHHRDCYNQSGQCVFVDGHLSGQEWRDPAGEVPPYGQTGSAQRPKVCDRCGASNAPEQIFCQVCGHPLAIQGPAQQGGAQQPGRQAPYGPDGSTGGQQPWGYYPGYGNQHMPVDTISMAYGGLKPDETIDGESVKDIAQYVGSGSAYYLPRFRIMAEHARAVSINFGALVFGFFYYFYRKMYLLGGILLALFAVSRIPALLYTWEVYPLALNYMGLGPAVDIDMARVDHLIRLSNITQGLNFLIVAVMSFLANRFYFNRVISAVHGIRTAAGESPDPMQYSQRLAQSGGNNKSAVIAIIATLAAGVIVLSSIMNSFYARTQRTQNRAENSAATQSAVVASTPKETTYEESA